MGPEARLEQKLRQAVAAAGGLSIKLGSPVGIPDRLIILPGPCFIFVEMKAERGRVSEIQTQRLGQLKTMGCDVRVIRGAEETDTFCREIHEKYTCRETY